MKILNLHIQGFGKFHNRSIKFEDGINVVYGKNEAGKSTLHTFIRGMFYGIEKARGRASKNDTYSKFEPWENGGAYEGWIRVEFEGHIYRIERSFLKSKKVLIVVDETLGKMIDPSRAWFDRLLGGLSETAYNNTISIGQLKSATDGGMITELKNYIANMNTTGNMALNITKASQFLKNQRKELECQMMPEAARSYTALLGEIRNIEKEISSPEYENQINAYQQMKQQVKGLLDEKQEEREGLLQKIARGKQILESSQFTDQASIDAYRQKAESIYGQYQEDKFQSGKKLRGVLGVLAVILGTMSLCSAGFLYYMWNIQNMSLVLPAPPKVCIAILGVLALLLYTAGLALFLRGSHYKKHTALFEKQLSEVFQKHLGDAAVTEEAMTAFRSRMEEFTRLCTAVGKSEEAVAKQAEEISGLQNQENTCSEVIEKQQRIQWELEKKLEHLDNCRNQAEVLRHVLVENDRIREEITAIDLAQETMTGLSTSIRDSFGLYLNKTASELVGGITGGRYTSMSIDENLNAFLNTKTKLVPLEQVSSGTMDQVYLALRLATAKLIQNGEDNMPLIFDDSFVLYDDERLRTALKWLAEAYKGQMIIFTCHTREREMLEENKIQFNFTQI